MEEKDLPFKERIRLRALAAQVDKDAKHLGLNAHTPRPWDTGDRVRIPERSTDKGVDFPRLANVRGQSGIVSRVEYMGSYEPGKHPTQRWNPAQDDPHADDFTIPIDPETIRKKEEWERLHDWRVYVQLEGGEEVRLWPYEIVSELGWDVSDFDSPSVGEQDPPSMGL